LHSPVTEVLTLTQVAALLKEANSGGGKYYPALLERTQHGLSPGLPQPCVTVLTPAGVQPPDAEVWQVMLQVGALHAHIHLLHPAPSQLSLPLTLTFRPSSLVHLCWT
jgi:hypothetical protein